jgi:Bacterial Ig domain
MRLVFPKAPKAFFTVCGCLALIASMASPAAAQTAGNGWQTGPGAILDNTYAGFVDQPSNGGTVPGSGTFTVTGWFVDQTAEGWAGADQMQVWLGTMDGGGKMLASGAVALPRPDVATALGNPFYAASGFAASVPGSAVPGGPQTLNVYMHTGGKGWWFKPVSVNGGGSGAAAAAPAPSGNAPAATGGGGAPTGAVTAPTEGQNVSAKGSATFTIEGNASDPAAGPGGIDSVDVWIFGERDSGSGTDLGTANLNGDGTWSLSFSPTKFPSTHTNIYVYIHSKASGQTTELIRGFNIVG